MDWIDNELNLMNFGDPRLNKRAKNILKTFSLSPEKSIPSAHNGWKETKAAYRFLSNPKVKPEEILALHRNATLKRIEEHETIVVAQDTTELDYGKQSEKSGRGPTNHKSHRGVYLHPLLAMTENGLCLGLLGAEFWHRDVIGERNNHLTKPIEEKESFRWLQGLREVNELGKQYSKKKFVIVSDAEADIFEVLAEKLHKNVSFVVRGHHDRTLSGSDIKLKEAIKSQDPIAKIEFEFKDRNKSASPYRRVEQEIRIKKVDINPSPNRGKRINNMPATLTVILATEISPNASPLEWMLFTNIDVETPEEASKILQYYLLRWKIEIYFKVLKSGCKVEELQLNELTSLVICLSFYMIVAWRILYLMQLGRDCPEMSCEVFFEEEEWRTAYMVKNRKQPPEEPPPLNEMIRVIASLGGFLGRKSDGEPGPKHLWVGIQRTRDFVYALNIHREVHELGAYG
jgi:hypothetical protein